MEREIGAERERDEGETGRERERERDAIIESKTGKRQCPTFFLFLPKKPQQRIFFAGLQSGKRHGHRMKRHQINVLGGISNQLKQFRRFRDEDFQRLRDKRKPSNR
jgi:hypothetical protein